MTLQQKNQVFLFLLILAMAIWGFTWSAAKIAVGLVPPEAVLFWRFVLTFFSFIPVVLFTGTNLRVNFTTFLHLILASIFYTFYNIFFLLGLELGQAGAGGVLVTTLNPILTFLFLIPVQRILPAKIELFGLLLGLVGGFFLLGGRSISAESLFQSGNIFFVLASISWVFVSFSSRLLNRKINTFVYSYYVYGISILLSLLYTGIAPVSFVFAAGITFWITLTYVAIISTTFATTIYFFAAARLGSARASSYIFLVPVTAMFGAMVILGEMPGWKTVSGGVIAIVAVLMINRRSA